MVLNPLLSDIGTALMSPVTYWVLSMFFSIILFILIRTFTDLQRSYAGVVSLLIPVLLLELGLKSFFSTLGVDLDFGTYRMSFPLYGEKIISEGVMLMRFLDFVFNFGLFRAVGLPVMEEFIQGVPQLPEPSTLFKTFVALYVSADSIIEYIFFFIVFSAMIVIIADFLSIQVTNAKLYAMFLAAIPVFAYNYYISNPFEEYDIAMPGLQKVFFFFEHADSWSLSIFLVTLIVSFVIVMEILATAVGLFYGVGSSTFRPGWVSHTWAFNVQGEGFLYTLSFAVMYALHQFSWYIFFPALVVYSIFKKVAGGAINTAKAHQERQDMRNYIGDVMRENGGATEMNVMRAGSREGGSNILTIALVIGILGMLVLLAMNLKLI